MACAQGVSGSMAVQEVTGAPTWSSGDTMIEFLQETMARKRIIGVPNSIRGTRSKLASRARLGPYVYEGNVHMTISPGILAILLPWMLGADASGTTFALAEGLQAFAMIVNRVTQTYEYQDCVVNRWVLHGKAGPVGRPNFLTLSLNLMAKARATGVSFPSVSLAHTAQYGPYVHQDCVLTLESATREVKEFWLMGNNHVEARYVNSLSPTALCPSDRTIQLRTIHPYDSGNSGLVDTAVAGAAGTLAITNGAVSTSFAFANLKSSFEDPTIEGLGEIDLQLDMTSYQATDGTKELIVTNDSTP